MTEQILFYVRNGLLLIFGVLLSAAFAGIRPTKKSALALSALMIAFGYVLSMMMI